MKRAILIVLFLALSATSAMGHGKSLSVDPGQVRPGEQVAIKGAGLGHSETIKLTLEGALNTYPLGEVQGDAHGGFQIEAVVPKDVKPGSYTVKAQAGSSSASAALKVLELAAPIVPITHQHGGGAPHGEKAKMETHASLTPLQLRHTRSTGETATIWGLILLAALGGGLLWFKS